MAAKVSVRFGLSTLLVSTAVVAVLLDYIGSYYRLSRRGVAEAQDFGLAGFLYVSYQEAAQTEDLSRHYQLAKLYAPLNSLDQIVFAGEKPTQGVTWRLSP